MTQAEQIFERLNFLVKQLASGKPTVFAKKAGIPHPTFLKYMKGRSPNVEHLCAIRDTYGVSIDWVLTGEGEPFLTATPPAAQPEANSELAALIGMTAEILQSGTDYADSLAANIRSFHKSVEMERRLAAWEDRGSADTADRLDKLERMCEEIKANLETPKDEASERPAEVAAGGG
jgi:transcriptional regulator with XRE-family HTH domain